ncbi:hypothetical protein [Anabaena sp. UHCC 0204]|uniref:hypothetical protein n=1 Tax=Anabaena sp. UHCC 0204 TaxID=2590009 RepID=UPI001448932D|nr:hypothetical protein [Anabaena sp. UHCC 0204]MTJ10201.1 hypothetical protein [Anabaena sp. UHCC 0204]
MGKADINKLKALEEEFNQIEKAYKAICDKLNETYDPELKNKLILQKDRLEKDMVNKEKEIEELKFSIQKNDEFSAQRSFLSYLANRSHQEFELTEAIENRDPSRLLVCIIHGDELQSHTKFLERMQNDFLPHVLGLDQNKTTVKIKKMTYSSELKNLNELPKFLLMNLRKTLLTRNSASLQEINELFNKSSPMIVYTDLVTDDLPKQGFLILNKLLECWQDWHNQNTINENVIVCICVKYKRIEWRWNIFAFFKQYHYQQINKKMRKHIQEFSSISEKYNFLSVVILSELEAIGRADVENWADCEHTKNFVGEDKIQQLKDKIGDMFDKWQKQNSSDRIPMRYLADNLIEILENLH